MADAAPRAPEAGSDARRRDYAIEILRWICILSVVAHHAIFPERYSKPTMASILELKQVLGWCVLAFFSISGALTKPDAPLWALVRSRAQRLLVPYLAVSLLSFSLIWVVNRAGIYHTSDAATACDVRQLLRNLVQLNGYGPQLYFLPYLFLVTMGFRGLVQFLRPSTVVMLLSACMVAQAVGTPWPDGSFGPGFNKLLLYTVAFALGHWSRRNLEARHRRPLLLLATVVGVASAWAVGKTWPVDMVIPFWIYAALSWWSPEGVVRRLLDRTNPGAVYLWHVPLLLPAISVGLNRAGIVQGWNYLGSCLLVVPASLGADWVVRKMGLKGIFSF